jgi:hypothetical protein
VSGLRLLHCCRPVNKKIEKIIQLTAAGEHKMYSRRFDFGF